MAFRRDSNISNDFSTITISLASPESVLERSFGEVLKPETINYRTYKPERDGLFCERIFGPVKDYECHCGKYKRIRYKGIICDRCGVEVTEKKVRRERTGHIQLVVPVAHIWFFRSLPNKIGALLGLPSKKMDSIIYYERYVVIQPGVKEKDGIKELDFLSEEEYFDIIDSLPDNQHLDDSDPNKFIAKMGAEALQLMLQKIDLDQVSFDLRHKANTETSQQRKQEALKRLQVFEAFRDARTRTENRPEWMILKIIPVIPPELRPLVPLDGGRFATSDLNDLYRRVIIRNNRFDCNSGSDTGAVFIQTFSGRIDNVTLEGNLLEGRGYNLGLEQTNHPYANLQALNNRFSPTGWGPAYVTGGPGWRTWQNNYRYDPTQPDAKGTAVSQP